jgi:hypothetical protein
MNKTEKYEPLKIHVDKTKGSVEGITALLEAIIDGIKGVKGSIILKLSLEEEGFV